MRLPAGGPAVADCGRRGGRRHRRGALREPPGGGGRDAQTRTATVPSDAGNSTAIQEGLSGLDYRVIHLLVDLGWVKFDLGSSPGLLGSR